MDGKALSKKIGPTTLPGCVLLVVVHGLLYFALAERDIPSVVFSPGGTAPVWMLLATAIFAVVRLLVFFWVPAVVTIRLSLMLIESRTARDAKAGKSNA